MTQRIQHPEHGQGAVVTDLGDVLVVEFDSGLLAKVLRSETRIVMSAGEAVLAGRTGLPLAVATKVLAAAIRSTNDRWGVFSASRIALLPHQLWVAHKVLARTPSRWLIADDVGLGKTIEAGIILSSLLSRGRVRRLLVIAPASLVGQWQDRLKTMFDVRTSTYHPEVDTPRADFWNMQRAVVASMQTLRLDFRDRWERLLDADAWDLVVVDEAHHLNADERGGATLALDLLQQLEERRKIGGLLLFTGTPHRGKDFGFLSLLQLLDGRFSPRVPLEDQVQLLAEFMIRNNKQNVTDMAGKKLFQAVRVHDVQYTYSPEESEFYSKMTEFILTGRAYAQKMRLGSQRSVMLVLITLQKLAASSVAAVLRALVRRLARLRHQDRDTTKNRKALEEAWKELQRLAIEDDPRTAERRAILEEEVDALMDAVELNPDEIPRLEELVELAGAVKSETRVGLVLDLIQSLPEGEAVLLFTEYKATQALVFGAVAERYGEDAVSFINGDGFLQDVVIHGQHRRFESVRASVAEAFNSGKVRFLLSTEAAGEGIDLQERCHTLVHIDLPWNPMRMHQRVGRLNRYGQRHPVDVHILRNPDTVESRIWEKLNHKLDRIAVALQGAMTEPDDIHALVLGMVGHGAIERLAEAALGKSGQSFHQWFDQETATFGGEDVVQAVRSLVGNVARFDFGRDVAAVPKVDLEDLRPFLRAALSLHGRRLDAQGDTVSFVTPEPWKKAHWAMLDRHEKIHFDRHRKSDRKDVVFGSGHVTFDAAIDDALLRDEAVAVVPDLPSMLVVVMVQDDLTTPEVTSRRVLVGARPNGSGWELVEDWQVILVVNRVADRPERIALHEIGTVDREHLTAAVAAARLHVDGALGGLGLPFRKPKIELFSVLLPAGGDISRSWPAPLPAVPAAGDTIR
jgi:ERCC4-related helicase